MIDSHILALGGGVGLGMSLGAEPGFLFGLGALAGMLLSPDLDCIGVTHAGGKLLRKWGALFWVWRIYWWPYSRLIPHRSWVSHAPVLGTAFRLLYVSPFILFVLWHQRLEWSWDLWWTWGFWPVMGLVISDYIHWIRDGMVFK